MANPTVEAFAIGAYEDKLNAGVVEAMTNHNAMAEQALQDEDKFKAMAKVLVNEVYLRIREKAKA